MVEIYQVKPSDKLLRWIHPGQFKEDENRPTTAAFRDDQMSVDILCLTTLEESYSRAKRIGKNAIISIEAQLILGKGLEIYHAPTADNYAHALVVGKKTNSINKFLAQNSEVEISPTNQ